MYPATLGQKKIAVVERFKRESMYGLSAKNGGRCKEAVVVEVAVRGGSTVLQISTTYLFTTRHGQQEPWLVMDSYCNCDNFFYDKVRHDFIQLRQLYCKV